MLLRRLRPRAPAAVMVSRGFVKGRQLTFHKVSHDGSGKCDMREVPGEWQRVHGVLFSVTVAEMRQLDEVEGLGRGYRAAMVHVHTMAGVRLASTYQAISTNPTLRPYHWYKDFVVDGAVEHGLPSGYVRWLRATESRPDPDHERRSLNEEILSGKWEGAMSHAEWRMGNVRTSDPRVDTRAESPDDRSRRWLHRVDPGRAAMAEVTAPSKDYSKR